jgi:uncharacterized membrane protein YjjB (DUF3815 family)
MRELVSDVLLAGVATLGFAVLFNAPRRVLWLCAVAGGLALLTREGLLLLNASQNLATLAGGLVLGIVAELGARRYRVPALVFAVTGFIPLVPGALSYQTVLALLDGDYLLGLTNGLRTSLLAGALAIGIVTATALFRLPRRRARS